MSKGENSPGISRLAGALWGMSKTTHPTNWVVDFGVIQNDGSLRTNMFPTPIQRSDYLVCRGLKYREVAVMASYATVADYNAQHTHTVNVPVREPLAPGDHVLVVWVANDAIVVDVIVPADNVL